MRRGLPNPKIHLRENLAPFAECPSSLGRHSSALDPKAASDSYDFPDWDPEDLKRYAAKLKLISLFGFPRGGVAYEHFNFSYPQKAVARLAQLVTDHRPSRLIAMTVIPAFGPWLYRHPLPTFTLGGDMPGYPEWVSSAGISFGRLVEDAGTILRAQGHRRILVPIHAGRTELRNAAIAASAASWAVDIPAVELKAMFPFQGQRLPDIHAGFWPRIMPKLRPTAVIVKDHHEYLSLLSYCIRHGLRIPEDLSVVQLSSDANSTWLTPSPDRYEFPVKRICQIVMRWLQQAPNPVGKIHRLSATHVKGGTVATCRK